MQPSQSLCSTSNSNTQDVQSQTLHNLLMDQLKLTYSDEQINAITATIANHFNACEQKQNFSSMITKQTRMDSLYSNLFAQLDHHTAKALAETLNLANLREYPTIDGNRWQKEQDVLVVGDLHANFLLFVYILIKERVLILENGKDDYDKLVNIYDHFIRYPINHDTGMPDFSAAQNPQEEQDNFNAQAKKNCEQFNRILAQAEIHNVGGLLVLLGDETADRGPCDYQVLGILDKLRQGHVDYHIIASNHGADFVCEIESDSLSTNSFQGETKHTLEFNNVFGLRLIKINEPKTSKRGGVAPHQKNSLGMLKYLIQNNIIEYKDIATKYDKSYKTHLELFSYSIDTANNIFHIYSHTRIGLRTIREISDFFNMNCDTSNIMNVTRAIDNINEGFKELVMKKRAYTGFMNRQIVKYPFYSYPGSELFFDILSIDSDTLNQIFPDTNPFRSPIQVSTGTTPGSVIINGVLIPENDDIYLNKNSPVLWINKERSDLETNNTIDGYSIHWTHGHYCKGYVIR